MEKDLREQFSYFGRVRGVRIIRNKGIAFVEMNHPEEARLAIIGLDGIDMKGRIIHVEAARPRSQDRSRDGEQRH